MRYCFANTPAERTVRVRRHVMLSLIALLATVLVAGVLGGCAKSAPAPDQPASPAPLSLMSAQDKFARIAGSFPAQVPVPVGTIVSGQAQGDTAWDYTIVVSGNAASVREWYRQAYGRAEWTVVRETSDSLSFEKNAAQSHATFAVGDPDGSTRVTVTVGVGTPVLELQ